MTEMCDLEDTEMTNTIEVIIFVSIFLNCFNIFEFNDLNCFNI